MNPIKEKIKEIKLKSLQNKIREKARINSGFLNNHPSRLAC